MLTIRKIFNATLLLAVIASSNNNNNNNRGGVVDAIMTPQIVYSAHISNELSQPVTVKTQFVTINDEIKYQERVLEGASDTVIGPFEYTTQDGDGSGSSSSSAHTTFAYVLDAVEVYDAKGKQKVADSMAPYDVKGVTDVLEFTITMDDDGDHMETKISYTANEN